MWRPSGDQTGLQLFLRPKGKSRSKMLPIQETPKRIKRLVREYAGIAHDRELEAALLGLRGEFDRWQRGEITPGQLTDLIHQFHQGPARRIWAKYSTNHLNPAVAYAIAMGFLRKDELPQELLQYLSALIELYEAGDSAP